MGDFLLGTNWVTQMGCGCGSPSFSGFPAVDVTAVWAPSPALMGTRSGSKMRSGLVGITINHQLGSGLGLSWDIFVTSYDCFHRQITVHNRTWSINVHVIVTSYSRLWVRCILLVIHVWHLFIIMLHHHWSYLPTMLRSSNLWIIIDYWHQYNDISIITAIISQHFNHHYTQHQPSVQPPLTISNHFWRLFIKKLDHY